MKSRDGRAEVYDEGRYCQMTKRMTLLLCAVHGMFIGYLVRIIELRCQDGCIDLI